MIMGAGGGSNCYIFQKICYRSDINNILTTITFSAADCQKCCL